MDVDVTCLVIVELHVIGSGCTRGGSSTGDHLLDSFLEGQMSCIGNRRDSRKKLREVYPSTALLLYLSTSTMHDGKDQQQNKLKQLAQFEKQLFGMALCCATIIELES